MSLTGSIVGLIGCRCMNLRVTLMVPHPPHSLPFTEWAEVEKLHSAGTGHCCYDPVFVHHWVNHTAVIIVSRYAISVNWWSVLFCVGQAKKFSPGSDWSMQGECVCVCLFPLTCCSHYAKYKHTSHIPCHVVLSALALPVQPMDLQRWLESQRTSKANT